MEKTVYDDHKYSMQDAGTLYIGAKYSFGELLDNEEINFKFRMIVNQYILPEADREDTLESHFYYLDSSGFLVKLYDRMKTKIKVNVLEERKPFWTRFFCNSGQNTQKRPKRYVTKTLGIKELVNIGIEQKQEMGMVIQEISISKLALVGL